VAEGKVNDHQDVISRMSSEISRIESTMTDKLQYNTAEHEHTESTAQLAGKLII